MEDKKLDIPTYEERRNLFEAIKSMTQTEYEEIFRILKNNKETYTENSNGIFFDVSSISDETYKDMNQYILFCRKNKENYEERAEIMKLLLPNSLAPVSTNFVFPPVESDNKSAAQHS